MFIFKPPFIWENPEAFKAQKWSRRLFWLKNLSSNIVRCPATDTSCSLGKNWATLKLDNTKKRPKSSCLGPGPWMLTPIQNHRGFVPKKGVATPVPNQLEAGLWPIIANLIKSQAGAAQSMLRFRLLSLYRCFGCMYLGETSNGFGLNI